jgi:hypothetical protein
MNAAELHDAAVHSGTDGYIDPNTGLFVFTAAYHLARGTCCDSGCRHCPFAHDGHMRTETKTCGLCSSRFECTSTGPGCWCEQATVTGDDLAEVARRTDDCVCPGCLRSSGQRRR